jgi:uncharacterized paraquat-inducible protein A
MTYLVLILVSITAASAAWLVLVLRVLPAADREAPLNSKVAGRVNLLTAALVVLASVVVAVLLARGGQSLSLGRVLVAVVGSILGTAVLTAAGSAISNRIELRSRAGGRDAWAGVREASARVERSRRTAAELRQTPPTVLRCGACGRTNPAGHYVRSDEGLLLCSGCHGAGYGSGQDVLVCPSCGYRLSPGDNAAYAEHRRCSNCRGALV